LPLTLDRPAMSSPPTYEPKRTELPVDGHSRMLANMLVGFVDHRDPGAVPWSTPVVSNRGSFSIAVPRILHGTDHVAHPAICQQWVGFAAMRRLSFQSL
jgi:hypothetical protein